MPVESTRQGVQASVTITRDAGTATLKVDNNLWNYLPKIARTIRVPTSMMMGSWMGTDLTNDDLVRESSYEEDYISELVGPSADPPGWLVRLQARPDLVGLWARLVQNRRLYDLFLKGARHAQKFLPQNNDMLARLPLAGSAFHRARIAEVEGDDAATRRHWDEFVRHWTNR